MYIQYISSWCIASHDVMCLLTQPERKKKNQDELMQYYAMCKHPTNPMAYNKASCVFAVGALVSCYTNNCVKVMCVCVVMC